MNEQIDATPRMPADASSLAAALGAARPKRVLLIDPDAASREIETLLVRYYGYDVRSTAAAVEGLSLARAEQPDAVICELFAAAPGGCSTVALLKAHPATARIPVIVVTACDSDGEHEQARAAGAAEILSKPCRGDLLKAVLEHLIGIPRLAEAA